MSGRIAVVGVACRYPDADSPQQLWENVLAGRRAFRVLPDERMRAEDYYSPDPAAPDKFYSPKAAVIEGFEFDRVRHRVAGSTFRSTDMTHWLALDTAARALADAGFPDGAGLSGRTTGVIIGNTLTGEFTRANVMRLRWPYVRRTVGAALRAKGWDDAETGTFLADLEGRYKAPFPGIDEDTLAGGLANTIAGRICNHFDFAGGGFTVDGACSSSLLSVATACDALAGGRLDAAVAGGVDLSIDPFEVIGFAKTGALATGEMRVYDKHSNGFWPGEGCGMLVLMREADALERGLAPYATIAGWGYSSDGKGGMTRPEASGHRLAIERAYAAAGFGIDSVSYLEGHGTGTAVGDATELRAFSEARRAADPAAGERPAAISTVKGNFGHTKAAAGVAGLIKAVLAVRHQVIPPATGHVDTHPELAGDRPALRVPDRAELWPADRPVRAAVSSMGFGGINAHVIVDQIAAPAVGGRRADLDADTARLVRSRQDAELLLIDAAGVAELRGRIAQVAALCGRLSYAEVGDLAATLQAGTAERPLRAAVVAASPEEAERKFSKLLTLLDDGARAVLDPADGVFLGSSATLPRIVFLFPGQGAGRRGDGGALRHRFAEVGALYEACGLPVTGDLVATEVAQPRIVTSSAAGLRVLSRLGIEAVGAAGHSLGELTALHWAGALDEAGLLAAAAARGRIMAAASEGGGAMAGIVAGPEEVEPLLAGEPVVIAGYNGPTQTVVSGPADAVERVGNRAAERGLDVARIAVSHAFHSELVAPAAEEFRSWLAGRGFSPLSRRVVSTVTGAEPAADVDVAELLARQIREPVHFAAAVGTLAADADLLIEVGPGRTLRGLAAQIAPAVPVVSMETDSPSLAGLLRTVAVAYVLGAPVRHGELFADRFTRPLPLDKEFSFFTNPCEAAPADIPSADAIGGGAQDGRSGLDIRLDAARGADAGAASGAGPGGGSAAGPGAGSGENPLEVLVRLAAERAELPVAAVRADSNPLDELHLSSITVGQIVNQACRELGLVPPAATTAFATSTIAELAAMLEELGATAREDDRERPRAATGVAPWVRAFAVDLVPAEAGPPAPGAEDETGGAGGSGGSGSTGVSGTATGTANTSDEWRLFAPDRHPLATALHEALRRAGLGDGVLLCMPRSAGEDDVQMMLRAARAALAAADAVRFVVVGERRGAAALAKTLHLEAPSVVTTVVTLPLPLGMSEARADRAVHRIVRDVAATSGFSEVHYDSGGQRRVPVLRALPAGPAGATGSGTSAGPLGSEDVLLVTGGGKGITAECALDLGLRTGAAVGLLGRSDPAEDAELAGNLERLAAAGVRFHYARADVTSADEVKAAVEEVRRTLGPVTAVLHGAGRNVPVALVNLDEAAFRRTLAPKISGLEAVLSAVDPAGLRLLVTFGSIIGRAGLRGQADYAVANDWMTDLTHRVAEEFPGCKCLALEWSVWSGAGMGEKLGVLESLVREGIEPIPAEEGVALLSRLIADPQAPTAVVVMGRAEGLPTITLEPAEVPLLRFLDRVQVHYPGVEMVADCDLSADSDAYLADHLLDGDLLFPAVFGMEAMTQAASALVGTGRTPVLEDVEFLRPIVVPVEGATTLRVAVLAEGRDTVAAVIRSSETGFQADHFRATLRFGADAPDGGPVPQAAANRLPLDPAAELYGPVLFQGARFQRLIGYRTLTAKRCVADLANQAEAAWFAPFVAGELLLADPGTRDAAMHAIQCCVPDATLLPARVERLHLADREVARELKTVTLHGTERFRDGDTYVWDVDVRDTQGRLLERWEGMTLRAVRRQDGTGPWLPPLLGPYLERRAETVLPAVLRGGTAAGSESGPWDGPGSASGTGPVPGSASRLRVAVRPDEPGEDSDVGTRRRQTAEAVGWLLGTDAGVRYRPDGKPETDGAAVSSAHGAGLTFSVAGTGIAVACDVEAVQVRTEQDWAGLLGEDALALARLIAAESGEGLPTAATRVWGALEALGKNGRARADLVADGGARPDHWVVLRSGGARIATFATTLRDRSEPTVFTLLVEEKE
ncbi:type I polyketide synthase [Catenulispora yoronensis]|uniref:Type I polyketide synthase n=1 Tax=Catenulispora yoronensis TaxID=450799 RepID=A0ABP5GDU9_9ACTN